MEDISYFINICRTNSVLIFHGCFVDFGDVLEIVWKLMMKIGFGTAYEVSGNKANISDATRGCPIDLPATTNRI